MCGFVGFTGDVENKEQVLTSMMDRIVHRGPDMGDTFFAPGVALGFRRLSILDLTPAGSQPMSNEDGSVVIVFNGEIYNFTSAMRCALTLSCTTSSSSSTYSSNGLSISEKSQSQ